MPALRVMSLMEVDVVALLCKQFEGGIKNKFGLFLTDSFKLL